MKAFKVFFKILGLFTFSLMLIFAVSCTEAGGGGDDSGNSGGNEQLPDYPLDPDNPNDPNNPENPDNPNDPNNPENPDNPNDPNNPENPEDPNPDDPDDPEPTPGTEYDVTNLVVAEKTVDSVTISFQAPQEVVNGFYFTVNDVKSDWVDFYDENLEYDYRTDTYSYTFTDKAWRSENGTSVTIKVTTDYVTYDSDYNEIQKESEGVSVTVTTKPFDGTLPAYTGNYSRYNLNSIKVGGTFDEKGYLSEDFDLATWEFKSSDETIATVDENGIVTGVKSGSAKIMFKNTDGVWYYREYTIIDVLAKGMAINTIFSKVGGTLDADDIVFTSAEKDFAVSDKNITWSVDDSSMATIADGKITFIKEGTVTVTATYNSNTSVTASATVNVLTAGAKFKEDLTYDKENNKYDDTSSDFVLEPNAISKITNGKEYDFSKDFSLSIKFEDDFKYTQSNNYYTVESIPVIESYNTVSVYYTFKNIMTNSNFNFKDKHLYLDFQGKGEKLEDGSVKYQLGTRTKEFVYFNSNSEEGTFDDVYCRWYFNAFSLAPGASKTFKVTYQIKNHTGSLNATIY